MGMNDRIAQVVEHDKTFSAYNEQTIQSRQAIQSF